MSTPEAGAPRRKFAHIVTAGISYQGGVAAVDTQTLIAALVHGLTGSTVAVGAAAAISRYGWLFPQIIVAHLAQRRQRRMAFYGVGAFGRTLCLAMLAALLGLAGGLSLFAVGAAFFVIWTVYAFIGGIVAVPYNDIVGRTIPSPWRSRLLAMRFFGGGLLALAMAALAHWLLQALPFPVNYAVIVTTGSLLMLASTLSFISVGEPPAPAATHASGFGSFLLLGIAVLRQDERFRRYVYTRWLAATVSMAYPFYILQARTSDIDAQHVALFLGLQTLGNLLSNPLWGWWGDHWGKGRLLVPMALLGAAIPLMTVIWLAFGGQPRLTVLYFFGSVFFLLGAVNTGDTIAHLGYLMEISPDDQRPAYSGYFSMVAAPAALSPVAGALVAEAFSLAAVFWLSLAAALVHLYFLRRLLGVRTEPSR